MTMSLLKVVSEQKPRQIAIRVLKERLLEQDYTENLFERELSNHRLPAVDRGLCQELVYGIARWQMTLDWLIARKTEGRTQKDELRLLLQLGLYQMFWLDRIPNHAAVHETVELAKQLGLGPMIQEKTGLVLDAYFSATKIDWILDTVPGARRRAEEGKLAFGTIDSWLIWKLSGGRTDVTDPGRLESFGEQVSGPLRD